MVRRSHIPTSDQSVALRAVDTELVGRSVDVALCPAGGARGP